MLKIRDLASRSDFQVGPLSISPSRRRASGPSGEVHVPPLVMRVFLLLLDSDGRVVTRDELFDQCWGGVIVGDDSLNRAVASVRKIGAEVAPGYFEIETIPRTGYRLTGEIVDQLQASTSADADESSRLSRRTLVAGGVAAAALVGGGGLWWANRTRTDPGFTALMARGEAAFRDGTAFEIGSTGSDNSPAMIRLYEQAIRLNSKSATAWGLLAYFRAVAVDEIQAGDRSQTILGVQDAARRALALDPKEPNARVALWLMEGNMPSWAERDRQLRDILATDPQNLPAMRQLMPLLQAAGLTRESWMWNEHILKLSPYLRTSLVVRALKLWILGRVRQSDDVINRVIGLWPDYWFARYARFNIFALTGRPHAARADLDVFPAETQHSLAVVLDGLETGSSSAIEAGRRACVEAAQASPPWANDFIMYLCALGFAETAIELTEGFLLWRGKFVSESPANRKEADAYARRFTQWLFTPPVANMRADPRFLQICEAFGLTDYWRERNVKPDYMIYG